MVRMWSGFVSLIRSIIAASVVDLPEPVGPTTSTMPYGLFSSVLHAGGQPSSSSVRTRKGTTRRASAKVPRWLNALARKRPSAGTPNEKSTCLALCSSASCRSSSREKIIRSISTAVRTGTFSNATSWPSRRTVAGRPTVRWRSDEPELTVASSNDTSIGSVSDMIRYSPAEAITGHSWLWIWFD